MGPGRDASGQWLAFEDFRWAPEFIKFLDIIGGRAGVVDLVLNGDTFELLQSPTVSCPEIATDVGCSESAALARFDQVLAAHKEEVRALAKFARSPSHRVVILAGDHDAALLVPSIRRRLLAALGAPSGRVEAPETGSWLSGDGRIYVEHGHQIGFSPHRFETWPSPTIRRSGQQYLVRPWGEQAIQDVYDRYEDRYPIIDNLAAAGVGARYVWTAEGVADAGDRAANLLRYFLSSMSWQQFRMELDDGEVQPPTWDVAQVRAQGAAFLTSSLPDDDRFKPLAVRALADGRLAKSVEQFGDDEITALCDYRAAVRRSRRRFEPGLTQLLPRGPVVTECPRTLDTRGGIFDYFWRSRDTTFMRHLDAVSRRVAVRRPIAVFVHGHTHLPDRAQDAANLISGGLLKIPMEGFSPTRGALAPVVINGGAWQRTITPAQLEGLASDRGLPVDALLGSLQPEDLPACYSFVEIGPYADTPSPRVRYWRPSAGGRWDMGPGCR